MDVELLSKMLKELVLDNDKVTVPGLGAFVAEIVPSTFSDRGYTINPPYRKLSFRSNVEPDNLLRDFYASRNNIDRDLAGRILDAYGYDLRAELENARVVALPGFGRLRCGRDGNVFFIADEDLDIFPAGFGLEPVSLKTHSKPASFDFSTLDVPAHNVSEELTGDGNAESVDDFFVEAASEESPADDYGTADAECEGGAVQAAEAEVKSEIKLEIEPEAVLAAEAAEPVELAEPVETEPAEPEPAESESEPVAAPAETEPAEPVEPEPVELAEPVETEPDEPEPVEPAAEAEPASEAEPAEPVEPEPAEAEPAETEPEPSVAEPEPAAVAEPEPAAEPETEEQMRRRREAEYFGVQEDDGDETGEEEGEESAQSGRGAGKGRGRRSSAWKKFGISLVVIVMVVAIVAGVFFILADYFPDILDRLLYTKEELEILNYVK